MVNLIFIGGTMGVGKTTVGRILKRTLPRAVYLDGDWCWNALPFVMNDNTKAYMLDNIAHLLANYIDCGEFDNIVFTWVMHRQSIVDTLVAMLGERKYCFFNYSLVCSAEALKQRLEADIESGVRSYGVVGRSVPRLPMYYGLDSVKIDTDGISADDAAKIIENDVISGE